MRSNDLRTGKLDTAQYGVCVCIYFYDVSITFYDVITYYCDVCISRSLKENTHLHLGNSVSFKNIGWVFLFIDYFLVPVDKYYNQGGPLGIV